MQNTFIYDQIVGWGLLTFVTCETPDLRGHMCEYRAPYYRAHTDVPLNIGVIFFTVYNLVAYNNILKCFVWWSGHEKFKAKFPYINCHKKKDISTSKNIKYEIYRNKINPLLKGATFSCP